MSTSIVKGCDLKIGDMIIEYTESGDIKDIGIVIGPRIEHEIHIGFNLYFIMGNRGGWWAKKDSFPLYINKDYIGFEWIGQ